MDKEACGKGEASPLATPLRRTTQDSPTADFLKKVAILAARFFPPPVQADLSDLEQVQESEY